MSTSPILPWPSSRKLRPWQQAAFDGWSSATQQNFCVEATPGAGKTTFALKCAHTVLKAQTVRHVIIVCPTEHLKVQWMKAAHGVSIQLEPRWDGQAWIASDMHGIAITYAQAARRPQSLAKICRQTPTLVIFDEIHHAGSNLAWGDGLEVAFASAKQRLLITGTPFRSDDNQIPYIEYHDNIGHSDIVYGYAEALRDNVVRPVVFHTFDGQFAWQGKHQGYSVNAATRLDAVESANRMRVALGANGGWVQTVLNEAHQKLTQVRAGEHQDAGGLVITKDKEHARDVAKVLHRITGTEPVIVLSDSNKASQRIKQFANSSQQWIVAVKMVSEGVDIPRLRVLVYATNVMTRMYFRQSVGRIVRIQSHLKQDQHAHFFMLRLHQLLEYATEIELAVQHMIDERARYVEDREIERDEKQPEQLSFDLFQTSSGEASDVVYNGTIIARDAYVQASLFPDVVEPAVIAYKQKTTAPLPALQQPESLAVAERKEQLRATLRNLVGIYSHRFSVEHRDVYAILKRKFGKSVSKCNVEELQKRIAYLREI